MENLYLICLIPPLTVIEDIDEIRNTIANKYHIFESLKRPVHITLYNPVKIISKALEERFFKALDEANYAENFDLVLHNFSSFAPHTVFIDVVKSKSLMDLQLNIKTELKPLNLISPKDQIKFNPHLTVAFRDVKPDTFLKIMEE